MPALKAPLLIRDHSDLEQLMRLKDLPTDRDLARAAGLHHSTVNRIRGGRHCHLDNATKIADALGVRVDKLFRPESGDDVSQPPKEAEQTA